MDIASASPRRYFFEVMVFGVCSFSSYFLCLIFSLGFTYTSNMLPSILLPAFYAVREFWLIVISCLILNLELNQDFSCSYLKRPFRWFNVHNFVEKLTDRLVGIGNVSDSIKVVLVLSFLWPVRDQAENDKSYFFVCGLFTSICICQVVYQFF